MMNHDNADIDSAPDLGEHSSQRSSPAEADIRVEESSQGNLPATGTEVGETRSTAAEPVPGTSPTVEGTEVDRNREEIVEVGGVEPHSAATSARYGATQPSQPDAGAGRRHPAYRDDAADREGGAAHRPEPERAGRAAEPGLPIAGYLEMTVPEIIRHAATLPIDQLRQVKEYEKSHRRRKTLLTKLERMLRNPEGQGRRPNDRPDTADRPHTTADHSHQP